MRDFNHIAAGLRLFCGSDSLKMLGVELDRVKSRRAAVFCGATVARSADLLGAVREILGPRCVAVFDRVRPHSPIDSVQAGADMLRESQADAVIAVGGGSAIVTARAANVLAAERGELPELCSQRGIDGKFVSPKLRAPKLPQLVIPTTPTTAMVKVGSAVFNPQTGRRMTIFDPKTRAHAILIHPQFVLSAPRQLALTASLNTLAMAVEGLESPAGNPLSDGMLMHSLRLLSRNLGALMEQESSSEVRCELVLASIVCGQGTDHASPGVCAALGHALGTRAHIDNGLANGILLPHTMRFNAPVTQLRLGKVAEALGRHGSGDRVEVAIQAVEDLVASVQVPRRLRDAGVPREVLRSVAQAAMDDWFLPLNPRPVEDEETLLQILEAAW